MPRVPKDTQPGPSALRRSILKLLAGTVLGAGLGRLGVDFAFAAEPLVEAGDKLMSIEFDWALRSRVLARQADDDDWEPLTRFEASETLRLADGKHDRPVRDRRQPTATRERRARPRQAPRRARARRRGHREGGRRHLLRPPSGLRVHARDLSQCRQCPDRDRRLDQRRACAQAGRQRCARLLVVLGRLARGPPRLGAAGEGRFQPAQFHGHERHRLRRRHAGGRRLAARLRAGGRACRNGAEARWRCRSR